ncbi:ATP-dependent DNA ligase [Labilithrix luteola]|uniref:DNA ligase (ATP) n=1 Tax=Labilithrix luteola TaxID=1391654 RepID=A0A0K1PYR4_9BACT|nr:non-homologous end-joining DNA ligase [Labilithrix luteola]AKU98668.1 ATP-dependent DNA ligase [Labilithrix luteola]
MTPTGAEKLAAELSAPVGEVDGRKIAPMLLAPGDDGSRHFGQPGWTYELKLDGARILADKRGKRTALTYRKLRDATESYPEIVEAVSKLAEERVVLDGEVVAFDEAGKPDFERLGQRITVGSGGVRRAMMAVPVVFIVFDILAIGDRDLRRLPIEARRAILERVVPAEGPKDALVRLHPSFDDGAALFSLCRQHALEGVVAKRNGSIYRVGERSLDWVKIKCELEADFVVVGYTEGEGNRSHFGALLLASYDNGKLVARGRAGSGLDERMIATLLPRLKAIEVKGLLAEGKFSTPRKQHFVKPEIVVSIRYMSFSSDGALKHPVFRGVRPDVDPEECTTNPDSPAEPAKPRKAERSTKSASIIPEAALEKDEVCTYYEHVGSRLLPWLRGRPCLPLRFDPKSGVSSATWPLPRSTPASVRTSASAPGMLIDQLSDLRVVVDLGAGSIAVPAKSDFIAIHAKADGVVGRFRELASAVGLPSLVKTSGVAGYDLLLALGPLPRAAVQTFGELVLQLVRGDDEASLLDTVVPPWALVFERGIVTASLPLDENELLSPSARGLKDARARAEAGHGADAAAFDARAIDPAKAVAALERIVAARGGSR